MINSETGNLITGACSSTEIPDLSEFRTLGFSNVFQLAETAVIVIGKETQIKSLENLFGSASSEMVSSVQKQLNSENSGEIIEVPYHVEAEIGSLTIKAKKLVLGKTAIFNTVGDFFEPTGPREKWHSPRLKELELLHITETSSRVSTKLLNRTRNQDEPSIIPTTLRNRSEQEGMNVLAAMTQKSEQALSQADFDNWDISPPKPIDLFDSSNQMDSDLVEAEATKLGISNFNPEEYEEPSHATNISVDEICVKGQKPMRPMPPELEKRKHLYTSVVHIENQSGVYTLVGKSIPSSLRLTAGFLEYNSILNNDQLVFFTDGAKEIHDNIRQTFAYTKRKIILDWFHLKKKFKEFGSLAFRGKKYRNEFLNKVRPVLWRGDVDAAIALIENTDSSIIKNRTPLVQLVTYLNRVRDFIPCYALRKNLGLRNSSNRGEKANDIVIAKRQKNNGTSWSSEGSLGLASLTCLNHNGELKDWVFNHTIPFKLVTPPVQVEYEMAA
jgi:hypothetical protein